MSLFTELRRRNVFRVTAAYVVVGFGGQGCTIFVKLQQFEADDDAQFVVDTKSCEWSAGVIPGLWRVRDAGSRR